MPDCPDRETLEYETRSWIYPDKEPVPLTTFVMKHISDILSDPDWRAWLEKEYEPHLETTLRFDGFGLEFWTVGSPLLKEGFKKGDWVKVTLERI